MLINTPMYDNWMFLDGCNPAFTPRTIYLFTRFKNEVLALLVLILFFSFFVFLAFLYFSPSMIPWYVHSSLQYRHYLLFRLGLLFVFLFFLFSASTVGGFIHPGQLFVFPERFLVW